MLSFWFLFISARRYVCIHVCDSVWLYLFGNTSYMALLYWSKILRPPRKSKFVICFSWSGIPWKMSFYKISGKSLKFEFSAPSMYIRESYMFDRKFDAIVLIFFLNKTLKSSEYLVMNYLKGRNLWGEDEVRISEWKLT